MRLKKSLLRHSATSFFSQIYTSGQILIEFGYSLIPVSLRAILMPILSQTNLARGIFKTKDYCTNYLRKCITDRPLNSEPLEVKG